VVVLDPRHCAARASLCFVGDGVGEAQVHRPISLPELRPKLEVLDEQVAERPEGAIGEPMVVAVDVRLVEPDASQGIVALIGRYLEAARFVGRLAIR
jgi:hypothetical protein